MTLTIHVNEDVHVRPRYDKATILIVLNTPGVIAYAVNQPLPNTSIINSIYGKCVYPGAPTILFMPPYSLGVNS